jgi:hypothetical protein
VLRTIFSEYGRMRRQRRTSRGGVVVVHPRAATHRAVPAQSGRTQSGRATSGPAPSGSAPSVPAQTAPAPTGPAAIYTGPAHRLLNDAGVRPRVGHGNRANRRDEAGSHRIDDIRLLQSRTAFDD